MTDTDQTLSTVNAVRGWRRVVFWPLGLLMKAWGMSLRLELSPTSDRAVRVTDRPVAFVLWHNRLFITAEVHRRFRAWRPIYGLVSASKDGAWLAAFFDVVGIRSVRGSSSKLAREAVNALLGVLRAGHDVGITPDGPRGPCYAFKPGALVVTRRTRTTILLLGAAFESAWRFGSWDRFYLPKPFSRVRLICAEVESAPEADRDETATRLAARLLAMNPDATDEVATGRVV